MTNVWAYSDAGQQLRRAQPWSPSCVQQRGGAEGSEGWQGQCPGDLVPQVLGRADLPTAAAPHSDS